MTQKNIETATQLLQTLVSKDKSVVEKWIGNTYIQHNLGAANGKEGFLQLLEIPYDFKGNTIRKFSDGNYVFTHTEYDFFGPKVGFDIFKFEDGKVVEHWDNLAEITPPNPSGNTQIDGATQVTDVEKTEENKKIVENFVREILIEGKMEKLASYFDGDNYIQHNSAIANGVSGLGAALEAWAKQGITMVFEKNHMILGQGDFVLSVSEGKLGGKHSSFYDLFRIENGKIAEHWDTIETIPPKEEWKNTNGKF